MIRTAIVRVGPDFWLHTDTNHASLGVTSINVVDGYLEVHTDFDPARERCLSATAAVDATLAVKGVSAGASGGAALTRYALSSSKQLGPYAPHTRIPANSTVFNSGIDNLWIVHHSLRQVGMAKDGQRG
ncbi:MULTISPECIES: hypothetical protein [unclassified Aeromicrobium]|uniref:hypothetical protein n=1 Tax=unclassified Aeromicrobium TaxID=2633570 RepID=UPI00288B446B|nr:MULTISPECIES: hypothetical protein [unclassified Aeromicrobium]